MKRIIADKEKFQVYYHTDDNGDSYPSINVSLFSNKN